MGAAAAGDKELTASEKGASRAERIEALLRAALQPAALEVIDDSHKHAGHAGARPGGETHFTVRAVAQAFEGRSRIDRQRQVNGILRDEFQSGLHALSLELKTPQEASS
jgi:BolA protein